ncbi:hypothetical protein ACGFMK_30425 [Amycolatopsis sp. NPDC049252]|uniref:Rv1733c family protein n=1 Tax=Amycolatopsis sp. NPDC049252 TaxID=3363933 RepID=UPI003711A475
MYPKLRWTRLWHSLLPARGLARPSDRVQAVLLRFVLLLSLVAAAGAVLFGVGLHAGQAAESREQFASRYTATAVLLSDGPAPGEAGRTGIPGEAGPARATWTTRDGQVRTGEVDAPSGSVTGDEVTTWLDAAGSPAQRPLTPVSAAVDAVVLAVSLWAAVVFVFWLAYRGVVLALDHFRLAAWQREWTALQTRRGRTRRDDQSPAGS